MKKYFNIILCIILCLNASIILFPSNLKFIPIIALLIFCIINLIHTKTFDYKFFVFSSLPYLILLLGMLYTENLSYGFKKLETQSVLLIYPLCFAMLQTNCVVIQLKKFEKHILIVFCLATVVFSSSILLYLFFIEDRNLTYAIHHFNTVIDKVIHQKYQIHSIYLALQIGLGMIFLIFINKKNKEKFAFNIICLILFTINLAIMNKRMSIIGIIIVGVFYFLNSFKNFKSNLKTIIIGGVFTLLLILGVILLPRFQNQNGFKEIYNLNKSINDPLTSIGKRVFIYKSSFQLVKESSVIGYGTGDANDALFFQMSKKINTSQYYNTHNQFLSFLLFSGLIGFFIFGYYIFRMFKISINNGDLLFSCLLLFFILNMLSENILEREAGVLSFGFFCNLYLRKNWNYCESKRLKK